MLPLIQKLRRKKNFTNGFKNQEVSQKKKKKKCIGELDDIFQIIIFKSNILDYIMLIHNSGWIH